jgi:4-hydroxy-3-polyprenylbenzoate decarboxylase
MTDQNDNGRLVVGVTGASGAVYAHRLIECLCKADWEVHLVVSPHGQRLLREELGVTDLSPQSLLGHESARLIRHDYTDVGAAIASGSFPANGMIVCPCSGNTLASMATGLAANLLERAAAVTLKERRPLIVVPREMPVGRNDLLNALRLTEAGGIVCPASPGFYMKPRTIGDLVDFVVGRVLDLIRVPHTLDTRWADRIEAHPTPQDHGADS